MRPYYEDDAVTLYHADAIALLLLEPDLLDGAVLVTDPPYGIAYHSNRPRRDGFARKISGDKTTQLRDLVVALLDEDQPALIFGSPRIPKPPGTKGTLVWDKGGALGMGDLSLPWKFDHEEVYVLGRGFEGRRDCGSVMRVPPVQTSGRFHPNEKPVELMTKLIAKCPTDAVVLEALRRVRLHVGRCEAPRAAGGRYRRGRGLLRDRCSASLASRARFRWCGVTVEENQQ